MKEGYVYILINASLQKNTLKIGMTTRTPEIRSEEMSEETGLPSEYMVAYKRKVSDCEEVEALIHDRLKRYRITHSRYDRSREFFVIPLEKAISVFNELADQFKPDISNSERAKAEDKIAEEEKERVEALSGDMPNGQGTYTLSNGDKYVGNFKDGKYHGQGTYFYHYGPKYEGEWKDGKKHGQGTHLFCGGGKQEGEWKDGKLHGYGTYTLSNGDKYVGNFKDDISHGQGTYFYPDGSKYEGEFKRGERHGRGTYTYPNGKQVILESSLHAKRAVDKKTKKVLDKSFIGGLFSRKARQRAKELRKAWNLCPYPYPDSGPRDFLYPKGKPVFGTMDLESLLEAYKESKK